MANEPYSAVPTVEPDTGLPDVSQHLRANPEQFGAGIGQATEQAGQQFGSALSKVGATYNEVAADDASNQFQSAADKLLHGDPEKPITNPDGTQSPDLGFMGLKGADAMRAAPAYNKKLDDLLKKTRSGLLDTDQIKTFDNYSRRYRGVIVSQMGTHADTQSLNYAQETNVATAKINLNKISAAPDDEEGFKHASEDTVNAYVKTAMLKGAKPGDPLYEEAVTFGKRDAMTARLEAISVNDPARALKMTEDNKGTLGVNYDNLSNKFRARADTQTGNAIGDAAVANSGATLRGIGGDAKGVLRNFEGFKAQAYWDHNAFRAGYGSDTVTKADGSVVPVTKDTVVTQADAERDLDRRTKQSQRDIIDKVGDEAWNKLSDRAKASVTSVAYNYGTLPESVAGAIKSGDPSAVSTSILGLSGHNGGINAGRRSAEAGNVSGGDGGVTQASDTSMEPTPVGSSTAPVAQTYAQMEANATAKILGMHLPPAQEAHALQRVRTTFQSARIADEQTKAAAKERNDTAADNWVKVLHGPVTPGRDVVHEIMNDPNLTWETRRALGDAAEKHAGTDAQSATATYGPGFWDAYKAVNLPAGDPNRISDPTTLLNRAGPKGDLTLPGVEKLTKMMKENQTSVDTSAINTSKTGLIKYAEGLLSYDNESTPFGGNPLKDPKGRQAFNAEFIPKFEASFAQWIKDGKDPYEFLTRENVQKMAYGIRSPNQVAIDKLIATGGVGQPEAPGTPIPPPPEGVSKAGWDSLMQTPPLLKNSGERMSHAQWSVVLQQLRENDTPAMRAAFDKWGSGANFKAQEVLERMGGKSPAKPTALPTAAQTGVLPKETLPPPAKESAGAPLPVEQRLPVPSLNPRGP